MIKLLRKKSGGFTLVEILIVIVILGILAGLAIPILAAQTQRAYRQEALATIGQIRSAMATYYSLKGATYTGAEMTEDSIGFDPTVTGGQTPHFTYDFSVAPDGDVYTIRATSVTSPSMASGLTVTMDQAGTEGGSLT